MNNIEKETSQEEERLMEGVFMLENPADGSFIAGLKLFMDWVQSIVATDQ